MLTGLALAEVARYLRGVGGNKSERMEGEGGSGIDNGNSHISDVSYFVLRTSHACMHTQMLTCTKCPHMHTCYHAHM